VTQVSEVRGAVLAMPTVGVGPGVSVRILKRRALESWYTAACWLDVRQGDRLVFRALLTSEGWRGA
jgi:hypothetical protein